MGVENETEMLGPPGQLERLIAAMESRGTGRHESADASLLKWLMGIIGILGVAGILGGVHMSNIQAAQTEQIASLQRDVNELRMEIAAVLEQSHAEPKR